MKQITTLIACIALLASCGPSQAEIELNQIRQQQMTDSVNMSLQREAERQESLKADFIVLKSKLAGAKSKLESIEGFKLLRSKDEKAKQVTDQTQIIEELEGQIEEVKSQMK